VTDTHIRTALAEILQEIAGVSPEDVTDDSTFLDLEVDSLTMVEVITAAEDRFGVRIPDAEMTTLQSVRDAVHYIRGAAVAA
jgi:acyl carrier protein